MRPVSLIDVKQALHDERFCALFPELEHEIDKLRKQPACGTCSVPLAHKILNDYSDRIGKYFPNRTIIKPKEEAQQLAANYWTVINCKVSELEDELRKLPVGRKQIAITRYEDQVTCVVNELMVAF